MQSRAILRPSKMTMEFNQSFAVVLHYFAHNRFDTFILIHNL